MEQRSEEGVRGWSMRRAEGIVPTQGPSDGGPGVNGTNNKS